MSENNVTERDNREHLVLMLIEALCLLLPNVDYDALLDRAPRRWFLRDIINETGMERDARAHVDHARAYPAQLETR